MNCKMLNDKKKLFILKTDSICIVAGALVQFFNIVFLFLFLFSLLLCIIQFICLYYASDKRMKLD